MNLLTPPTLQLLTIAVHSSLHPSQLPIAVRLNNSELLRLIDPLTPRTLHLLIMGVCLLLLVIRSVSSFSSRSI
jgi:hypothetical protein